MIRALQDSNTVYIYIHIFSASFSVVVVVHTHTYTHIKALSLQGGLVAHSQHSVRSPTQTLARVHFRSCHFPIVLLPAHN